MQSKAAVRRVKVQGLDDYALYRVKFLGPETYSMQFFPRLSEGAVLTGAALRNGGLPVPMALWDYQCWQYHITRCEG